MIQAKYESDSTPSCGSLDSPEKIQRNLVEDLSPIGRESDYPIIAPPQVIKEGAPSQLNFQDCMCSSHAVSQPINILVADQLNELRVEELQEPLASTEQQTKQGNGPSAQYLRSRASRPTTRSESTSNFAFKTQEIKSIKAQAGFTHKRSISPQFSVSSASRYDKVKKFNSFFTSSNAPPRRQKDLILPQAVERTQDQIQECEEVPRHEASPCEGETDEKAKLLARDIQQIQAYLFSTDFQCTTEILDPASTNRGTQSRHEGSRNVLLGSLQVSAPPRMTKRDADDFYMRQQSRQVDSQMRLDMLRQEKAQKEMQECRFKPNVATSATYFSKTQSDSSDPFQSAKRSFVDFLNDQKRHEERKQEKIGCLTQKLRQKEELALQKQPFFGRKRQPRANESTDSEVKRMPAFLRLYENGLAKMQRLNSRQGAECDEDSAAELKRFNRRTQSSSPQEGGYTSSRRIPSQYLTELRNTTQSKHQASVTSQTNQRRAKNLSASPSCLYARGIEHLYKRELRLSDLRKEIQTKIDSKRPNQVTNRQICGSRLTKELYACAEKVLSKQPQDQDEIHKPKFLQIMDQMGYTTSPKQEALQERELSLVSRMWSVLVQSYQSREKTTLSALKRFIFVIEGLAIPLSSGQHTQASLKQLQDLFCEFKPLYLARMTHKGISQKLNQPRQTCSKPDPNLTFKPILSPKSLLIVSQKTATAGKLEKRIKEPLKDECTFKPTLVARRPLAKPKKFIVAGSQKIPLPKVLSPSNMRFFRQQTQAFGKNSRSQEPKKISAEDRCLTLFEKAKLTREARSKLVQERQKSADAKAMAECTFKPETGKNHVARKVSAGRQTRGAKSLLFRKSTRPQQHVPVRQVLQDVTNLEHGMPTSREYFMPVADQPCLLQQLNQDLHSTGALQKASIQTSDHLMQNSLSKISASAASALTSQSSPTSAHVSTSIDRQIMLNQQRLLSPADLEHSAREAYQDLALKAYSGAAIDSESGENRMLRSEDLMTVKCTNECDKENTMQQPFMLMSSSPQPVPSGSRLTSESSGDSEMLIRQFRSVPTLCADDLQRRDDKAAFVLPKGQECLLRVTSQAMLALEERQPLLFIDVNMGPSRSERVIVREGDTPESLAKAFSERHNVTETTVKEQLCKLLAIQMEGLLEKIDERDEDMPTDYFSSTDQTGRSTLKSHIRKLSQATCKSIILSPKGPQTACIDPFNSQ